MSRLICNAAAPSLNAAVNVCVCVRWAHTQHTHLYQLLHLLCLFVSNSLINKFSKTKKCAATFGANSATPVARFVR